MSPRRVSMQPNNPPQRKPAHRSLMRGILLVIADAYTSLMTLFLLMRLLSGQQYWPIELGNNFLHWLLLPSLVLLPLMLFLRRWEWSTLHALPVIGFVVLYGVLFVPHLPPSSDCDGCITLRVMTYNMLGHDLWDYDYSAQLKLLRDSGADIIAVQELSRPGAVYVDEQLADIYPFRALHPGGTIGIGILSKYPLSDAEAFQVPPNDHYSMRAVVDLNGVSVRVFSAHPPPPGFDIRYGYGNNGHSHMVALTEEVASADEPTLFMGDLNMVDQTDDYRLILAAGLKDAYREAGWGFGVTWPMWWDQTDPFPPLLRLDYIFYSRDFHALRAWVGPTILSDHRPVLSDLVYKPVLSTE